MLTRRDLTRREDAFWLLVDASHERDETRRRAIVLAAGKTLTPEEHYLASMVIALFNFYNTFVDVNGVAERSREQYEESGVRLAQHGYCP